MFLVLAQSLNNLIILDPLFLNYLLWVFIEIVIFLSKSRTYFFRMYNMRKCEDASAPQKIPYHKWNFLQSCMCISPFSCVWWPQPTFPHCCCMAEQRATVADDTSSPHTTTTTQNTQHNLTTVAIAIQPCKVVTHSCVLNLLSVFS